jgi:short-subunit dehydrogenase involved in D-alanine esterification of teichoic acids
MFVRSVLITGCNRGIGLELVKQWLKVDNPPEVIVATCRKPAEVISSSSSRGLPVGGFPERLGL